MAIEMNDMKLTAFALGELHGPERATVEAHVAQDDAARRFVDEVRDTARVVTNELAHEPVVGLLAVHHAAIERQLEEIDHLRPMRIHRAPVQPLGVRMRHWAAFGLTAAAAVLIVGGAIAVLAPQLYNPNVNVNNRTAKHDRGPVYFPGYGGSSTTDSPLAHRGGAPDPFQRPDAIADDDHPGATPLDPALGGADPKTGVARDTRPSDLTSGNPLFPFGIGAGTDVTPRLKRPGSNDSAGPLARGGAERPAEYAPVRVARSDDNRGVENYASLLENPFVDVAESPLSTFAVNVDAASYAIARRALGAGRLPAANDVRVEEFLNYFSYDYKQPEGDAAFAANIEVADCPWDTGHRLVRIGLRGKDLPAAAGAANKPGGLVFLIDVSESMNQPGKLPVVKQAIRSLAETMTPMDRITLVTYGGAAGTGSVALHATGGKDKQKILDAIDALAASGAPTRGADAALDLAYKSAGQAFVRGGVNRVVLCTDGNFAANVADQLKLLELIDAKAKSNIALSVIGVGATRINDPAMRTLARRGNGTYAYADTAAEAKAAVAAVAQPAPATIAKDVKVQVEFNPLIAGRYRLIGYENGPVSADGASVDGQLAAGHTVTALYEVIPADAVGSAGTVFAYKYPQNRPERAKSAGSGSDELLTLKVHYLVPTDDKPGKVEDRQGKLLEFAVKDKKGAKYASASPDYKFAAAVAEFALILRGSEHRGQASYDRILQLASEGAGSDKAGSRREFVELVRKAQQVRGG